MATKKNLNTFAVARRFDVLVEKEIKATSFDDAVSMMKDLSIDDFLDTPSNVDIVVCNTLTGDSVRENYEDE